MAPRTEQRVPVRLPVSIGRRAAALSTDISHSGFLLETTAAYREGDPVSGYVLHGDKELLWSGRVAWVAAGDPMASTWHKVGVQFTCVSPGLRALLSMRQRTR